MRRWVYMQYAMAAMAVKAMMMLTVMMSEYEGLRFYFFSLLYKVCRLTPSISAARLMLPWHRSSVS